jgi:hypothetical protein
VKLWVEIIPANAALGNFPIFDIKPKPLEDFEVRLVVYDTKDIKMMDVEGTSDVYARAFFDPKQAKETDTHYRCTNGAASFNYRLLYNVKYPSRDATAYRMTVQLYDRDFFKSNDMIGEAVLDLKNILEDVAISKRPLSITRKYYEEYLKAQFERTGGPNLIFKDDTSFWLDVESLNQ